MQGAAKKAKKSTATLADLLGAGLVNAGAPVIITYKGQKHEGTLTSDAQISFQGALRLPSCRLSISACMHGSRRELNNGEIATNSCCAVQA